MEFSGGTPWTDYFGNTHPADPYEITAGPDGNVWYTEGFAGRVARITPSGSFTEFSEGITPYVNEYGISQNPRPDGIATGPDGNVWFTETAGNRVARINPTTGQVTEFSAGITVGAMAPAYGGIAAGPDGNMWFVEAHANQVARINPTTGAVQEFSAGEAATPKFIAAGPDGNMWFTNERGVGRITPSGQVTQFTEGITDNGNPQEIAAGPDGNMWFTLSNYHQVARITPMGTVTVFSAGITDPSCPQGIAAGPDGNMWFTEPCNSAVARITPSGTVTEFTAGITGVHDITAGPDGNMWFSEPDVGKVGRITTDAPIAPVVSTGTASAIDTTSATLNGSVNPAGSPVSAHFEYGTTTDYGSTTPVQTVTGSSPVTVSASLSDLQPGTTYHYRLVASNALKTNTGADESFTTALRGTAPPGGSPPPALPGTAPLIPPPSPGALDTSAPGVSGFGLTNNPFAVGGRTPTFGVAAKAKQGTTFRYTLSEAATVRIVIARGRTGRRKGKRCVAPTRKLRKARKCIRVSVRGTLTRTSRKGANHVVFSGRIGSKPLGPGSYQATLTATDAAKNTSKPKTITFKVIKR